MILFRKKIAKNAPKILILADKKGWIVDRVTDEIIKGTPLNFIKKYYHTEVSPEELLELSKNVDLIHFQNTDITRFIDVLSKIKVPFLMSIRSHRFYDFNFITKEQMKFVLQNIDMVHVVNKRLQKEFKGSVYIPNGISKNIKSKKEFTVGFAGTPEDYKGFKMIEQACIELNVKFKPATGGIPPKKMPKYYNSIDLLVSASKEEGFCNPVMECMAMNIPVISTDTGAVEEYNIVKIERTIEGIKEGILKFYTGPQVKNLTWERACNEFYDLYLKMIETGKHPFQA